MHQKTIHPHTWILVFICSFLALVTDGGDLMLLSYSLQNIRADFGLTQTQSGLLGTVTLAGMAIGGIFGGWACDRFGRVRTIVLSVGSFSVLTALLGFTQNVWQFGALRFCASLGLGSVYIAANTLMAEYVPNRYRTTVLGTLQAGWSVGYIVATLLAKHIVDPEIAASWRPLFFVAGVPVILAVIMHFFVPEPASWVENRNKSAQRSENKKEQSTWNMLFSDRTATIMFILWAITAGCLQFGYYGVGTWMPSYLEKEMGLKFKDMAGYMVGSYTAMILGKILAGYFADKFGRRVMYAFGAIGTAVFIPIIIFLHTPGNILWLLIIFGFLYGVPYGVNATYMTESFETKFRGTAIGGAYNIGRLGGAVAPVVIGYFADRISFGAGFLVMGVAYFFCGLIPALFIKDKLHDPQKA